MPITVDLTFESEFDELYNNFWRDYPELLKLEGIDPIKLSVAQRSHDYFTKNLSQSTIDTNANANECISPNNYSNEVISPQLKLEGYYLLWRYLKKRFNIDRANECILAIWHGDIYFHDPTAIQVPYCFAFSTDNIVLDGRPYGQLHSLPPKRSSSFISAASEVCMDLSQEFAGAIAPSDLIVNLAKFLKRENKTDPDYIVNLFQSFTHIMNNKFKVSGQSPFTNISLFDRYNLSKLFNDLDVDFTMYVQDIIAEWFSHGDPKSKLPYRFPVMTANMQKNEAGEILDKDFLDKISEYNVEKSVFNIYANEGSKIAMCCRFLNDLDRMNYKSDSFGNGGLNIGSHRVVTINLPRITLKYFGESISKEIDRLTSICKDLLLVHREEILQRRVERGFLKFFEPLNWINLKMFFSTIGHIGLFEMAQNLGIDLQDENNIWFAKDVLKRIEDAAVKFSKETGHSFNTEQVPGEGSAVILAKKDAVMYGSNHLLYSNQYIPLYSNMNIIDKIKIVGQLDSLSSGGSIYNHCVAEQIKDVGAMQYLIENIAACGVSHFNIPYGFGVCENEHTHIVGNSYKCPQCNGDILDHYTKIVGYFTKVSSWSDTRQKIDFPSRRYN